LARRQGLADNDGIPIPKETVMTRLATNAFRKHPVRFAAGIAINLGGVLALAAHLS
jgi:hypothetical protein